LGSWVGQKNDNKTIPPPQKKELGKKSNWEKNEQKKKY